MKWDQTSAISNDAFFGIPPTGVVSVTYRNTILTTFAARFGVASDHTLLFAKAGGATSREKFEFAGSDPALGAISGS
jgi:hypothetical protein